MSEEERQFAAEHHGLILSFLRSDSWELSEYYDIAAWGFLDAVIKYLRSPSLRKYPFSSLAWKSMRHSIAAFRRAEARRLASEQRYADTELPEQQDLFSELEAKLLLSASETIEMPSIHTTWSDGISVPSQQRLTIDKL